VKWPSRPPPLRDLGFPLQASDSKIGILTKEEFIRNKKMPLPKDLPAALVPHPVRINIEHRLTKPQTHKATTDLQTHRPANPPQTHKATDANP
jgi:hypothetical protein